LPGLALALVPFLALMLLSTMRQLNGALASRHEPGYEGIGVLDFPWLFSGDPVEPVRRAITAWSAAAPDERFADGLDLARRIILLDVAFMLVYGVGLAAVIVWASRRRQAWAAPGSLTLVLISVGLAALVGSDFFEGALAWVVITDEWGGGEASSFAIRAMALMTTLKLLLAGLVLIPVALMVAPPRTVWRHPLVRRLRIVLIVLAAFAVLVLLGIGGEQTAEVVRAWDGREAGIAGVAAVILALTTWAATRFMTDTRAWNGTRSDAVESEFFVLIAGIVLFAAGAAAAVLLEWSASLAVPGALLVAIAVLSFPVKRLAPNADEGQSCGAALWARAGRLWARVLAATTLFLAALVAVRAAAFDALGRDEPFGAAGSWEAPLAFALVCVLIGVGFLVIRRVPRSGWASRPAAAGVLGIVLLAGAAPLFGSPLEVSQWAGSFAVIEWFFASLIALLALGTRLGVTGGEHLRLPASLRVLRFKRFPTVLFVAAWIVLAALPFVERGGYHDVRVRALSTPHEDIQLEAVWDRWVKRNVATVKAEDGRRPAVPLVLVATAGGGIRAATWTSLALDCIFRRVTAAAPHCPNPPGTTARTTPAADRFFAAGGTSGGSVGLAQYDALLRAEADDDPIGSEAKWVEKRLGDDFVAPTVAGLLFRDLPRIFIGFDAGDRAALLEQGWERPWGGDDGRLADGFRATWEPTPPDDRRLRPLLLLNGTSVEDGCRFVTSVLRPSIHARGTAANNDCLRLDAYGPGAQPPLPDTFLPATTDLADFLCPGQDVRMSTAALLSARFAFVSPSGRLTAGRCSPPEEQPPRYAPAGENAATFVVDGGYFDNSGARVLVDLWRSLAPRVAANNADATSTCIVPVFVQLDNDGDTEPAPGPDPRPHEWTIPLAVIAGGISSHETSARAEAAAVFDRPAVLGEREVRAGGTLLTNFWLRLAPRAHPGPRPPLGWTLSDGSFTDMRTELAADYNARELETLAQLFSEDLTCSEP
jgi:hypothetical protein